ncbi:hypothetical protein JX265_012762 [Neoarthrinium moseri]|uniref:Uncharacterized protein n=1 Tax=Neoarthrinium moseri TaxID=1658444 RepID=A0A9Q0AGJ1_9PEZI|nr:uncharacterized protein JN550_008823 [Neoarthrinium moseri]KAI1849511.1 hypothetical protein JX266_005006 [Neoarthrinium moseri]KAI1853471.1 hypothetical protein JX265_012762 [Neoarthrinium moseri]KAI1864536.1 hypothetical protein JN550_008823 [Neoarthrinium moseri]
MSSSIAIPSGRVSASAYDDESPKPASSSSSSSSYSTSPHTPAMDKASPSPSQYRPKYLHQRRPSLLSTSFCKDECKVIDIGDPEGPRRLISYLSSSQGFVWNPEIFLPSYVDCDYVPLENRREPVHEIRLSDDEVKKMLPQ